MGLHVQLQLEDEKFTAGQVQRGESLLNLSIQIVFKYNWQIYGKVRFFV